MTPWSCKGSPRDGRAAEDGGLPGIILNHSLGTVKKHKVSQSHPHTMLT